MITRFFGKPGKGKTTYIAYLAQRENDRILSGKSKYDRVLTNVNVSIEAPTEDDIQVYVYDSPDFGRYDMSHSLILHDEGNLDFDNRDHKTLQQAVRQFLVLHRHYHTDICMFNQFYGSLDNRIRELTTEVYQLESTLSGKTYPIKIDYEVYFPTRKEALDDINSTDPKEVYFRAGLFAKLISRLRYPKIKRCNYYHLFDSYEAPFMPKKQFRKARFIKRA